MIMADCCLCVWARPLPYRRLISALYPIRSNGVDMSIAHNADVGKLSKYATDKPNYLPFIGDELMIRMNSDLRRGKYGNVGIVVRVFTAICESFSLAGELGTMGSFTSFENHIMTLIMQLINHPNFELRRLTITLCQRFLSTPSFISESNSVDGIIVALSDVLRSGRELPVSKDEFVTTCIPSLAPELPSPSLLYTKELRKGSWFSSRKKRRSSGMSNEKISFVHKSHQEASADVVKCIRIYLESSEIGRREGRVKLWLPFLLLCLHRFMCEYVWGLRRPCDLELISQTASTISSCVSAVNSLNSSSIIDVILTYFDSLGWDFPPFMRVVLGMIQPCGCQRSSAPGQASQCPCKSEDRFLSLFQSLLNPQSLFSRFSPNISSINGSDAAVGGLLNPEETDARFNVGLIGVQPAPHNHTLPFLQILKKLSQCESLFMQRVLQPLRLAAAELVSKQDVIVVGDNEALDFNRLISRLRTTSSSNFLNNVSPFSAPGIPPLGAFAPSFSPFQSFRRHLSVSFPSSLEPGSASTTSSAALDIARKVSVALQPLPISQGVNTPDSYPSLALAESVLDRTLCAKSGRLNVHSWLMASRRGVDSVQNRGFYGVSNGYNFEGGSWGVQEQDLRCAFFDSLGVKHNNGSLVLDSSNRHDNLRSLLIKLLREPLLSQDNGRNVVENASVDLMAFQATGFISADTVLRASPFFQVLENDMRTLRNNLAFYAELSVAGACISVSKQRLLSEAAVDLLQVLMEINPNYNHSRPLTVSSVNEEVLSFEFLQLRAHSMLRRLLQMQTNSLEASQALEIAMNLLEDHVSVFLPLNSWFGGVGSALMGTQLTLRVQAESGEGKVEGTNGPLGSIVKSEKKLMDSNIASSHLSSLSQSLGAQHFHKSSRSSFGSGSNAGLVDSSFNRTSLYDAIVLNSQGVSRGSNALPRHPSLLSSLPSQLDLSSVDLDIGTKSGTPGEDIEYNLSNDLESRQLTQLALVSIIKRQLACSRVSLLLAVLSIVRLLHTIAKPSLYFNASSSPSPHPFTLTPSAPSPVVLAGLEVALADDSSAVRSVAVAVLLELLQPNIYSLSSINQAPSPSGNPGGSRRNKANKGSTSAQSVLNNIHFFNVDGLLSSLNRLGIPALNMLPFNPQHDTNEAFHTGTRSAKVSKDSARVNFSNSVSDVDQARQSILYVDISRWPENQFAHLLRILRTAISDSLFFVDLDFKSVAKDSDFPFEDIAEAGLEFSNSDSDSVVCASLSLQLLRTASTVFGVDVALALTSTLLTSLEPNSTTSFALSQLIPSSSSGYRRFDSAASRLDYVEAIQTALNLSKPLQDVILPLLGSMFESPISSSSDPKSLSNKLSSLLSERRVIDSRSHHLFQIPSNTHHVLPVSYSVAFAGLISLWKPLGISIPALLPPELLKSLQSTTSISPSVKSLFPTSVENPLFSHCVQSVKPSFSHRFDSIFDSYVNNNIDRSQKRIYLLTISADGDLWFSIPLTEENRSSVNIAIPDPPSTITVDSLLTSLLASESMQIQLPFLKPLSSPKIMNEKPLQFPLESLAAGIAGSLLFHTFPVNSPTQPSTGVINMNIMGTSPGSVSLTHRLTSFNRSLVQLIAYQCALRRNHFSRIKELLPNLPGGLTADELGLLQILLGVEGLTIDHPTVSHPTTSSTLSSSKPLQRVDSSKGISLGDKKNDEGKWPFLGSSLDLLSSSANLQSSLLTLIKLLLGVSLSHDPLHHISGSITLDFPTNVVKPTSMYGKFKTVERLSPSNLGDRAFLPRININASPTEVEIAAAEALKQSCLLMLETFSFSGVFSVNTSELQAWVSSVAIAPDYSPVLYAFLSRLPQSVQSQIASLDLSVGSVLFGLPLLLHVIVASLDYVFDRDSSGNIVSVSGTGKCELHPSSSHILHSSDTKSTELVCLSRQQVLVAVHRLLFGQFHTVLASVGSASALGLKESYSSHVGGEIKKSPYSGSDNFTGTNIGSMKAFDVTDSIKPRQTDVINDLHRQNYFEDDVYKSHEFLEQTSHLPQSFQSRYVDFPPLGPLAAVTNHADVRKKDISALSYNDTLLMISSIPDFLVTSGALKSPDSLRNFDSMHYNRFYNQVFAEGSSSNHYENKIREFFDSGVSLKSSPA